METQMLKPYSFLLYILAIVVFFFAGIAWAIFSVAGKNQMLAGGAIVLGYGVVGAGIGLVAALLTAYATNRSLIVKLNLVLFVFMLGFAAYFFLSYQARQRVKQQKEPTNQQQPRPKAPTKLGFINFNLPGLSANSVGLSSITQLFAPKVQTEGKHPAHLGMFAPDMYQNEVLYFYANINHEKPLDEHLPSDSITFTRTEQNDVEIATAPPWLNPQHLKLDYGIIYFTIETLYKDFVEVVVNTATGQTALLSSDAGKIVYLPDFLLHTYSIKPLNPNAQSLKVKPLDYAGLVSGTYSLLQPIAIKQDWLRVALMDKNMKKTAEAWLKWRENGQLLIEYSLLC